MEKFRRNSFDSAPNARLRMSELSEAALFTRSGLTASLIASKRPGW
jgi:hypothetical protein